MKLISGWRERRRARQEATARFLGPKIELPGGQKQWIDDSMYWLIDQFGVEPLRRKTVLPSTFVPTDYDGSEDAARALCLKVCERVGVPADTIRFSFRMVEVRVAARGLAVRELREQLQESVDAEQARKILAVSGLHADMTDDEIDALMRTGFGPEIVWLADRELAFELTRCQEIVDEEDPDRRAELLRKAEAIWAVPAGTGTYGCYLDLRLPPSPLRRQEWPAAAPEKAAVLLAADCLADPATVVAALAHELGHEVLLGGGIIKRERADGEALTDLFAVFQGFGIFMANQAAERIKGRKRKYMAFGYLGESGFSDALSSYCFHRHRLWPNVSLFPFWRKELDLSVRIRTVSGVGMLVKEAEAKAIQEGAPLT
ncbi:hypothetical protein AB0L70_30355 [Kribbella sp. NPDC051952]|uniref:hypothetical protein n=1 Tax=Kribbella sp. NPDC051952 TaxID=3154851 RepID=UPI0034432F86